MKKGHFPKLFIAFVYGVSLLWPNLGYPSAAYKDLKKRDLHYLAHLKQELEKAENMSGGLERARELKRQIDAIERGTDVHMPIIQSAPTPQPRESRALPEPMVFEEAPRTGPLTLTETSAGNDIDLFHENTVTVGKDYGVPASMIETKEASSFQETQVYKPLEIPDSLSLRDPNGPLEYPMHGTPFATPQAPIVSKAPQQDAVPVDATRFQKPSTPLYGTPPGHQPDTPTAVSTNPRVVSSLYQQEKPTAPLPWKGDQKEADYLEEKLRAKLAQLAHARKKLQTCTGQEADAWTSRIYDLETEKRSLLRMMKAIGMTPNIKTVSLEEDPEFDTIQSQEYQLIRQINDLERQEKKVRRQMRFAKDPEIITNAGDLLSRLEQNRKLLETSLKTLKINSASVDTTAFVDLPTIYEPVKKQALSDHSTKEEESVETVEDEPKAAPNKIPQAPLESQEVDIMAVDDEDDCPLTGSSGFWTSNVPNGSKRTLPPIHTPTRPNREDVKEIVKVWKAG